MLVFPVQTVKFSTITLLFLGGLGAMTPDEREKMKSLCIRIQTEKNPTVFDELVKELNELIELKHQRIHPEHKKSE